MREVREVLKANYLRTLLQITLDPSLEICVIGACLCSLVRLLEREGEEEDVSFAAELHSTGVFDRVEDLQYHKSDDVKELAHRVVEMSKEEGGYETRTG